MHKATTENYTYVHTLALHDALPILKSLLHEIDSLMPQNLQPCLHRRGLGDHLAAADDAEPGGLQAQGVQHVAGLQDHHVGVAAGLQAVAAEVHDARAVLGDGGDAGFLLFDAGPLAAGEAMWAPSRLS